MKLSHRVRKHTCERHLQALRLVRARRARKTIPAGTNGRLLVRYERAIAVAVSHLGRRKLARVVWPWQRRPASPEVDPSVRVMRGRVGNPTALR